MQFPHTLPHSLTHTRSHARPHFCPLQPHFPPAQYQRELRQWTPPYVSARPEIRHHRLTEDDRFLILATDGLYQNMSRQEVVDAAAEWLEHPLVRESCPCLATYLTREALARAAKEAFGEMHPQVKEDGEVLSVGSSIILQVPPSKKRYVGPVWTVAITDTPRGGVGTRFGSFALNVPLLFSRCSMGTLEIPSFSIFFLSLRLIMIVCPFCCWFSLSSCCR